MTSANYKITATPLNEWDVTDKIEIVLSLDLPGETKIFKGIIPTSGIIKKVKQ